MFMIDNSGCSTSDDLSLKVTQIPGFPKAFLKVNYSKTTVITLMSTQI